MCNGSTLQFEVSLFSSFCILCQDQIRIARMKILPAEINVCMLNCSLVSCYWPCDCILSRQKISLTFTWLFAHDKCFSSVKQKHWHLSRFNSAWVSHIRMMNKIERVPERFHVPNACYVTFNRSYKHVSKSLSSSCNKHIS